MKNSNVHGTIREGSFCCPCICVDVKDFNFVICFTTNCMHFVINISKTRFQVIIGWVWMISIYFSIITLKYFINISISCNKHHNIKLKHLSKPKAFVDTNIRKAKHHSFNAGREFECSTRSMYKIIWQIANALQATINNFTYLNINYYNITSKGHVQQVNTWCYLQMWAQNLFTVTTGHWPVYWYLWVMTTCFVSLL